MNDAPPSGISADDLRRLARERLLPPLAEDALAADAAPRAGDYALNGPAPDLPAIARARPAAVLAAIVERREGLSVLLDPDAPRICACTPGRSPFPAARSTRAKRARETALREAREEIGLEERYVEPLGWLDPYLTSTGFRIAPLVALVDPGFALLVNAHEVAEVFEAPFAFLMNPANHRLEEREWQGRKRKFYAMPYGERYIWGATAGIIRNLYARLFS